MRDAIARVFPAWDESRPGYGYLLGMYCFALEESGDYARAEPFVRRAVELNEDDVWSIHAVAHVLEMQGRLREGSEWLTRPPDVWDDRNPMREHLWWHLAMFELERGRIDDVLALYDERFRANPTDFYLDLQNSASMLWRLECRDVDVGERWEELAEACAGKIEDHALAFTEPHHVMALGRAGRFEEVDRVLESLERCAGERSTYAASIARRLTIPLCRAVAAYCRGDYDEVTALLPSDPLRLPPDGGEPRPARRVRTASQRGGAPRAPVPARSGTPRRAGGASPVERRLLVEVRGCARRLRRGGGGRVGPRAGGRVPGRGGVGRAGAKPAARIGPDRTGVNMSATVMETTDPAVGRPSRTPTRSARSAKRCGRSAPATPASTGGKRIGAAVPDGVRAGVDRGGVPRRAHSGGVRGSGLGTGAAAAILEEIHASGGNGAACHAQMYIMGTILRHGSEAQKLEWLPGIARGDLRLQAFGVTEPTSGTNTLGLKTVAVRDGDHYVVNGQKVWTSRAEHSDLDLMLLLARTTPADQVEKRTDGLSVFVVDMRAARGNGLTIRPIRTMINHSTTEVFFDDMRVPAENLVGAEGKGFRYILDGMNAERIVVAAECIGDARWFVERSSGYARERVVFGRPIGQNQGVQFPIARAYAEMRAAELMVRQAAALFDNGRPCGAEANMAKHLAAEAAWHAADTCIQTFGGFGMAEEYDVERKFRETRLYQIAPISTNLILSYLGEHVLGMPRSY